MMVHRPLILLTVVPKKYVSEKYHKTTTTTTTTTTTLRALIVPTEVKTNSLDGGVDCPVLSRVDGVDGAARPGLHGHLAEAPLEAIGATLFLRSADAYADAAVAPLLRTLRQILLRDHHGLEPGLGANLILLPFEVAGRRLG